MISRKTKMLVAASCLLATLGACTTIRENRGFIQDGTLINAIQPGVDNRVSVQATLGRPTFVSQFGEPTWYYIASVTARKPFGNPRIKEHSALAVRFDAAGNVASVERRGVDQLAFISPDGDKTPTLGKHRGFLEDLFGNIGTVGTGPGAGGGGAGGPN